MRSITSNEVRIVSTPCPVAVSVEAEVIATKPKIELFGGASQKIDDKITLAELDDPQHEVMKGMFVEAGIWDRRAELFGPSTPKSSRALTEASELLTEKLKKDWSQGSELKWKIQKENEQTLEIMIADPTVSTADVQLSKRSSGFKSYFYLHMRIKARMHESGENNGYTFLFDEPGTYLHPRAQIDLQRAFERHADKGQMVYTTHSLFLVSKNYPERNRVISKDGQGTLIDAKPFTKNWKAIRESLGILMVNNFLISDKTLLVEGPSDRLYIGTALQILKRNGVFDIDLNDFSDVDAGQSDNYTAMAKLMKSEGRSIVCVVDGDNGGTLIREKTEKACSQEPMGNMEFITLGKDMSSEDIFADFEILKKAIKETANNVKATSERKFVDGFDIDKAMEDFAKEKGKTLGRTTEDTTKTWFEDGKLLSKLSIAARYAEIVRPSLDEDGAEQAVTVNLPEQATTYTTSIITSLGLKEEKSFDQVILG